MRQGYFALLTADPLRGALNRVEARLIEEARGEALFLIPYALRDLAEAWRLVYRDLGLRRGRVVYLRRREEAFDPEVARRVAESPLVILAAESLPEFLDLIRNSLLLQALAEVYRQGGGVVAVGEAAGLLGEAAFYALEARSGRGSASPSSGGSPSFPGWRSGGGFWPFPAWWRTTPTSWGSAFWKTPPSASFGASGRCGRAGSPWWTPAGPSTRAGASAA